MRGAPPSVQIDLFLVPKVGRLGLFAVSLAFRPGLASTCFVHLVLRVPLASPRGRVSTKCADPRGTEFLVPVPSVGGGTWP